MYLDITAFSHLENKPNKSSNAVRLEGSLGLVCNNSYIRRHGK